MDNLSQIGGVPVSTSSIAMLYPGVKAINNKVSVLCASGRLIRLKKGLFVARPQEGDPPISLGLVANHLYSPSFVSMHSALRFYGLIPESVHTVQSMTISHPRSFETPFGIFAYIGVAPEVFHVGVTQATRNGVSFVIATPERALCDLVANQPGVNLRYKGEAVQYITDNLRIDYETFLEMDPNIMEAFIRAGGKKATSLKTIISLL